MSVEPASRHAGKKRVLAFSGSDRGGSWNARLLALVAHEIESQRLTVTKVSLRGLGLPIYDGDLEAESGVPAEAVDLRRLIGDHDGLLIACPEHNGSVTALLKNALDWCSRPVGGEAPLAPFQMKPVLIVGASVSPFGAVRALGHLRAILSKMGAMVVPEDLAVPHAPTAFADDGFAAEATGVVATRVVRAFASLLED